MDVRPCVVMVCRFYFVYCEAAFDMRYIHNFHLTWVKDGQPAATTAATAVAAASSALSASAAVLQRELPSDPVTQALLGLYFFLVGMMVRGHQYMWILPLVSTLCALSSGLVHKASMTLVPTYYDLSPVHKAWWCADVMHLLYSATVSLVSMGYLVSQPGAWKLHAQPEESSRASVIVASATGKMHDSFVVLVFIPWLHVRKR